MQVAPFEQLPIFNELQSSMTTHNLLDCAHIKREVEKFYECDVHAEVAATRAVFPNALTYGLPTSLMIDKPISLCEFVWSQRFRWAWSDKGVQQEFIF